jgi:hypothetical protein
MNPEAGDSRIYPADQSLLTAYSALLGKISGRSMQEPYVSLTHSTIYPSEKYIVENFTSQKNTSYLKREVLARGAYLALIPTFLTTYALDILIGLGSCLVTFSTLGTHMPSYRATHNHLMGSTQLLNNSYFLFLRMVNPMSKVPTAERDGVIHDSVRQFLQSKASEFRSSDNYLKKEVASRLTYALLALASIVTRAVDGVVGILVATFSISTFGAFDWANGFACKALTPSGIIYDIVWCALKVLNPEAGDPSIYPPDRSLLAAYSALLGKISWRLNKSPVPHSEILSSVGS